MDMLTLKNISASLIIATVLSSCKAGQEPEVTKHATGTSRTPLVTATTPKMNGIIKVPSLATQIPDSSDDIWLAINRQSADLKKSIDSGTVDNVHYQAFAIRDLISALPSRSPQLTVSEQAKLQNALQSISILADQLDESGDANDRTRTLENYNKLVIVLNDITPAK